MAHVIRFSIDGLAGSDEVYTQTLNRDVNVFFGSNGSGKTSLLKILHSAMSGDTSLLTNIAFTRAEVTIYSIASNKEHTLTAEQIALPERLPDAVILEHYKYTHSSMIPPEIRRAIQRQSGPQYRWVTKPKEKTHDVNRWAHVYLPTSRLYGTPVAIWSRMQPTSSEVLSEEQLDQFYAITLQELWGKYYDEIQRLVQKAQEDGLANILKSVLSPHSQHKNDTHPVDPATAYQRAAAFLKRQGSPTIIGKQANFERHYAEDTQLRSVVSDINAVEEKIEAAMAPQKMFEQLVSNMFSNKKSLIIRDREVIVETKDKKPIGLSLLSSGEKHLLRLFIEALNAQQNSAIIDEPEISLHIDWQRILIASMRQINPAAQYILATHSPEIMADIPDDKIFRL